VALAKHRFGKKLRSSYSRPESATANTPKWRFQQSLAAAHARKYARVADRGGFVGRVGIFQHLPSGKVGGVSAHYGSARNQAMAKLPLVGGSSTKQKALYVRAENSIRLQQMKRKPRVKLTGIVNGLMIAQARRIKPGAPIPLVGARRDVRAKAAAVFAQHRTAPTPVLNQMIVQRVTRVTGVVNSAPAVQFRAAPVDVLNVAPTGVNRIVAQTQTHAPDQEDSAATLAGVTGSINSTVLLVAVAVLGFFLIRSR
jgi:hypothetical protein